MRIPVLFAGDFTPDAILWEGGQEFRRLDNEQRGDLQALVRSFCADILGGDRPHTDDELDAIETAVWWSEAWWHGDARIERQARRLMERMEGGFR